MRGGRKLKAVIPGGSSVPILTAQEIEGLASDYESVAQAGSMLGTASVIVMDDRTNMVTQVRRMVEFYAHESCGQCTPCREGTAWMVKILRRIEAGQGTPEDVDTLLGVSKNVTGTTICVLSDSVAAPVQSSIKKFRDEYLALVMSNRKLERVDYHLAQLRGVRDPSDGARFWIEEEKLFAAEAVAGGYISQQEREALPSILNLSRTQLEDHLAGMGEPRFRATQVWRALYHELADSFDDMTTLSKPAFIAAASILLRSRSPTTAASPCSAAIVPPSRGKTRGRRAWFLQRRGA